MPIYGVPPSCYAINDEDIVSRFNLNVFCSYFFLSNGTDNEDFSIISVFGVIFGQNFGFDPLGCPFIGFPSIIMQLILKILHQGLTQM